MIFCSSSRYFTFQSTIFVNFFLSLFSNSSTASSNISGKNDPRLRNRNHKIQFQKKIRNCCTRCYECCGRIIMQKKVTCINDEDDKSVNISSFYCETYANQNCDQILFLVNLAIKCLKVIKKFSSFLWPKCIALAFHNGLLPMLKFCRHDVLLLLWIILCVFSILLL